MRNRKSYCGLALSVFLMFGLSVNSALASDSFYCGRSLVKTGDLMHRVAQACPQPFWVERWAFPVRFGLPVYVGNYEAWSINFGSRRLLRRLVFHNGYLTRIQTLEHGVAFEPGSKRCRPLDIERAGNTASEIFARCGEPDYRYTELPVLQQPFHDPRLPVFVANRERWVYSFKRANDRELVFQDGHLQYINKLRR